MRRFLIVRADGSTRTTTRYPSLRGDEVAVRLTIKMPEGWGQILTGELVVVLPEPPALDPEHVVISA